MKHLRQEMVVVAGSVLRKYTIVSKRSTLIVFFHGVFSNDRILRKLRKSTENLSKIAGVFLFKQIVSEKVRETINFIFPLLVTYDSRHVIEITKFLWERANQTYQDFTRL